MYLPIVAFDAFSGQQIIEYLPIHPQILKALRFIFLFLWMQIILTISIYYLIIKIENF